MPVTMNISIYECRLFMNVPIYDKGGWVFSCFDICAHLTSIMLFLWSHETFRYWNTESTRGHIRDYLVLTGSPFCLNKYAVYTWKFCFWSPFVLGLWINNQKSWIVVITKRKQFICFVSMVLLHAPINERILALLCKWAFKIWHCLPTTLYVECTMEEINACPC